jgi:hypothetical protein
MDLNSSSFLQVVSPRASLAKLSIDLHLRLQRFACPHMANEFVVVDA